MVGYIKRIFDYEWEVQLLQRKFKAQGPIIKPLVWITSNKDVKGQTNTKMTSMFIQGSFDPPTLSHMELLERAVDFQKKNNLKYQITETYILFSYSHVEKSVNLLQQSLLGHRIIMLEMLLNNLKLSYNVIIGISNVARYLDLTEACARSLNVYDPIFIMGVDVFKKVLDQQYYSEPLSEIISLIFRGKYIIAGRNNIVTLEDFSSLLKPNLELIKNYRDRITFLPMPKDFWKQSATEIRNKFSKNNSSMLDGLHPVIMSYLKQFNLYNQSSGSLASDIAIQTIVNLGLDFEMKKSVCYRILKEIQINLDKDINFQNQIIKEYQQKKKEVLLTKWKDLMT